MHSCDSMSCDSIISAILADVNAIIPNFFRLTEGYRLMVGAAEEIRKTPDTPFEVFERAVVRYDRTGTLIDILLELLCCKITFSSEFLSVTCAPVDIIQQLANCKDYGFNSRETAENIILIEAMRRLLEKINKNGSCFGPPPVVKPPPPAEPKPPKPNPSPDIIPGKELSSEIYADLETQIEEELLTEIDFAYFSGLDNSRHKAYKSPLSRKHI